MKHGNGFKDRTGERFGRWIVLRCDETSAPKKLKWICRCDCGTERSVLAGSLGHGVSVSCGCISAENTAARNYRHGKTRSRSYNTWQGIRARCQNPNHPRYADYGGRGITVCERWQSFENFFADMGERPAGRVSIERIENNDGYHPKNCKWGTDAEQGRNRRSVRIIECDGLKLTVTEWGKRLGNAMIVFGRLKRGWDEKRAVTEPVKRLPRNALSQAS